MTEPGSLVPSDSHITFASSSQLRSSTASADQEPLHGAIIQANDPLDELLEQCPQFYKLVHNLSNELKRIKRSFDDVVEHLKKLVESILIPARVENISSLCIHLRKKKRCLESDVDLLCELFKIMQQDKLEEAVTAYANEIATLDVVKYLPRQTDPMDLEPGCFLMTTFHDISTLKFSEAFNIKKYLAGCLQIQRYMFTLVGSESGSIGLVWQVPNNFQDETKSKFKERTLKAALLSSEHHFITIKLTTNSGSIVVFTRLSHQYEPAEVASANPLSAIMPFTTVTEQRVEQLNLITERHNLFEDIKGDTCKYSHAIIAHKQEIGQSATDILKLPERLAPAGASTHTHIQDSTNKFTGTVVQEEPVPVIDESLLSYDHDSESSDMCLRLCQEEMYPIVRPPVMQSHAIMHMDSAPKFHCPCGKCTLEDYLRKGCREGNFPYLELSRLDEDDREDVIQQLSEETKKIVKCFCALLDTTCLSLKTRGVPTLELARRVLELGTYTSPNVQKPLMSEEITRLENSKSIEESFFILQPHMSFFNFELLQHIIEGRQTGSEEVHQQLDEYSKKFELYCKRKIVEVPPGAIGQSSTNLRGCKRKAFVILSWKGECLAEVSVDDAKKATRKIATLLGLKSSTLYLHKIDQGCLIFVFSVPEFVAQKLFPLSPSLTASLKKNGYSLFAISDTKATDQDINYGFQLDVKSVSTREEYFQIFKDKFNEIVSRTYDYLASGFAKLLQQVILIEGLFSSGEQAKLKEANTIADIFEVLENYWDFVNYSLLKFILDQCCNEELQKQMDAYIDALFKLPITTILVTKENSPSSFSLIVITLSVDTTTTYTLWHFEMYRQKLQEALQLGGGMALRTESINLEDRVAVLSLPRWYIPHLLDLHKHIQEVTVETIDGLMVEEYVKFFEDKPYFILEAAKRGLTEVIKTMLFVDKDRLVKEHDKEGNTALMFAVMSGRLSTVKVVTESGAHVNEQNTNGETALMLAVINKHTDIVKYLLFEANADTNIARYDDGFTALKWAAQDGLSDIMTYLIEAKADVNKHYKGWTALMSAAYHGTPEAIGILVDNGAIVDMKDASAEGMSALMWAARKKKQADVVSKFISAGADVNLKNREGKTALMLAAECGCTRNVANIVSTRTRGTQGKTCTDDETKCVVYLDLKDNKGETAIMKAQIGGHEEIVTILKEAGADTQQLEAVKNIHREYLFEEDVQFGYHDEVYGTNIELSGEKYTVANRKEKQSSENGITYSSLPLKGTVEFEVEITNSEPKKGSMSLGVVRVTKGLQLFRHKLVRISRGFANSCIWNTGKVYNAFKRSDSESIGHSYGYAGLASLKEGDRVGLQLSSYNGSLSFYVNQKHQGFAAKGVYDDKYDVYVVVEHTGGCIGTRITRAVMHERYLEDSCVRVIVRLLKHESQVESLPLPPNLKKKITTLASIS